MVIAAGNRSDIHRIHGSASQNGFGKTKRSSATCGRDASKCMTAVSGRLLWRESSSEWHLRIVEVCQGSLFVYKGDSFSTDLRLSLRHLSVQPCRRPRTFCLLQSQGVPVATFQALTDQEYEKWFKTLVVELARQTPAQDVRFYMPRKLEPEVNYLRRGWSEECVTSPRDFWNENSMSARCDYFFRRGSLPAREIPPEPKFEERKSKHSNDELKKRSKRLERRETIHEKIPEKVEVEQTQNQEKDVRKIKFRRSHKLRPFLPLGSDWSQEPKYENEGVRTRAKSLHDLDVCKKEKKEIEKESKASKKPLSDESGFSSGDENNNIISDSPTRSQEYKVENFTSVSVREKKKFFESLSSDMKTCSSQNSCVLTRRNSVGDVKDVEICASIKKRRRATSLHDVNKIAKPVREIRRMFEPNDATKDEQAEVSEVTEVSKEEGEDKRATVLLNQRRLQRGERKLGKLRIQIAEVEDTIAVIADDLRCIEHNALKRRADLEIFTALQRRLREETSRLERLQEETVRVIKDNQRTITKLKSIRSSECDKKEMDD